MTRADGEPTFPLIGSALILLILLEIAVVISHLVTGWPS